MTAGRSRFNPYSRLAGPPAGIECTDVENDGASVVLVTTPSPIERDAVEEAGTLPDEQETVLVGCALSLRALSDCGRRSRDVQLLRRSSVKRVACDARFNARQRALYGRVHNLKVVDAGLCG